MPSGITKLAGHMIEMTTELAMGIFDTTIQKLKAGEITFEEANRIGSEMPNGWNFEFLDFGDDSE